MESCERYFFWELDLLLALDTGKSLRRKETVFYHSESRGVVPLKSPNSDGGMALSRDEFAWYIID